uniref:Uncharacterized protein n=1 Tax=Calidris pygmaea TaxID=425635 RepID=A0A8C3K3L6_9CHAR
MCWKERERVCWTPVSPYPPCESGRCGNGSTAETKGASLYSHFHAVENYGGVYVGLPSDAAAMVSSQTKAAPKGIGRLRIALLLLSQFNFIY